MQEYNCNENTNVYTRLEEEETLNFPIPEKAQDRTLLANLYAKGISNNRSADELKFADEYLEKCFPESVFGLKKYLTHPMYEDNTFPELFYIDGKNARDFAKENTDGFDSLSMHEKIRTMKLVVLKALTSGQHDVEIATLQKNSNLESVGHLCELKPDYKAIDSMPEDHFRGRGIAAQARYVRNTAIYKKEEDRNSIGDALTKELKDFEKRVNEEIKNTSPDKKDQSSDKKDSSSEKKDSSQDKKDSSPDKKDSSPTLNGGNSFMGVLPINPEYLNADTGKVNPQDKSELYSFGDSRLYERIRKLGIENDENTQTSSEFSKWKYGGLRALVSLNFLHDNPDADFYNLFVPGDKYDNKYEDKYKEKKFKALDKVLNAYESIQSINSENTADKEALEMPMIKVLADARKAAAEIDVMKALKRAVPGYGEKNNNAKATEENSMKADAFIKEYAEFITIADQICNLPFGKLSKNPYIANQELQKKEPVGFDVLEGEKKNPDVNKLKEYSKIIHTVCGKNSMFRYEKIELNPEKMDVNTLLETRLAKKKNQLQLAELGSIEAMSETTDGLAKLFVAEGMKELSGLTDIQKSGLVKAGIDNELVEKIDNRVYSRTLGGAAYKASRTDFAGTKVCSGRFFGVTDSEGEEKLNLEFNELENRTGVKTINRPYSRNNLIRAFMLSEGASLADTFSDGQEQRAKQLEEGAGFKKLLKENPLTEDGEIRYQSVKTYAKMFAKMGKAISEISYPDCDLTKEENIIKNMQKLKLVRGMSMDYMQSIEEVLKLPGFKAEFKEACGIGCDEMLKNINAVTEYSAAVCDYADIDRCIQDKLKLKKTAMVHANELAGKRIGEAAKYVDAKGITRETAGIGQLLSQLSLDDIDGENYKKAKAYLNGEGEFPLSDDEIKASAKEAQEFINEGMKDEDKKLTGFSGDLKIEIPKSFDAEKKKKLLSLTAEKIESTQTDEASKDFDEIFNAKKLELALQHSGYTDYKTGAKQKVTDLFYIDKKPAGDYVRETHPEFEKLEPQEREKLIKSEILAAALNGRQHVDIATVEMDENKSYRANVSEVKLGLDAFNGLEGFFSRNRAKLAANLYKEDNGLADRHSEIQKNVSEKLYSRMVRNADYEKYAVNGYNFEIADNGKGSFRYFGLDNDAKGVNRNNLESEFKALADFSGIGTLERFKSLSSICVFSMMSEGNTLSQCISEKTEDIEKQLHAGNNVRKMLKANPYLNEKKEINARSMEKYGELFAKAGLKLVDEKIPVINMENSQEMLEDYKSMSALCSVCIDFTQETQKISKSQHYQEGFKQAAGGRDVNSIENRIDATGYFVKAYTNYLSPEAQLYARVAGKIFLKMHASDFSGKTIGQAFEGIDYEQLREEEALLNYTLAQLPGMTDEDSPMQKQCVEYLSGDESKCPVDIAELIKKSKAAAASKKLTFNELSQKKDGVHEEKEEKRIAEIRNKEAKKASPEIVKEDMADKKKKTDVL